MTSGSILCNFRFFSPLTHFDGMLGKAIKSELAWLDIIFMFRALCRHVLDRRFTEIFTQQILFSSPGSVCFLNSLSDLLTNIFCRIAVRSFQIIVPSLLKLTMIEHLKLLLAANYKNQMCQRCKFSLLSHFSLSFNMAWCMPNDFQNGSENS